MGKWKKFLLRKNHTRSVCFAATRYAHPDTGYLETGTKKAGSSPASSIIFKDSY